ncbi:hypothetical protein I8J29_27395 [Paenibacillus sp. MWE-103]|uniref:Uncharacterized protein n=1 Tax=Paenibacillus artemisiicola TaxID=1172618 RepID=A0ABS3WI07_9BACL|nr:hypothetical protein [Paenibacillus artemisiicola]MBO7747922.1 hypothetical protein [Paenibacillus artemisiicola]
MFEVAKEQDGLHQVKTALQGLIAPFKGISKAEREGTAAYHRHLGDALKTASTEAERQNILAMIDREQKRNHRNSLIKYTLGGFTILGVVHLVNSKKRLFNN